MSSFWITKDKYAKSSKSHLCQNRRTNIQKNSWTFREGFNKNKNKKVGKFPLVGRPPPPPSKVGKQFFLIFNIWSLKSVLMQRIFFLWWQWGKLGSKGNPYYRGPTQKNLGVPKILGEALILLVPLILGVLIIARNKK